MAPRVPLLDAHCQVCELHRIRTVPQSFDGAALCECLSFSIWGSSRFRLQNYLFPSLPCRRMALAGSAAYQFHAVCNCRVWAKRPAWPTAPTRVHKLAHAGESVSAKLTAIRAMLKEQSCDAILLTDLAEIAWAFNMRGADVDCNPVFVSYAAIGADSAMLYMHDGKVGEEVKKQLDEAGVTMGAYDDVRT